jgi:hypothetical protein
MKSTALISLFVLLTLTIAVHADGVEQNVIGIVTAISPTTITVETIGKVRQSVTVTVLPATGFIKDGVPASLKELTVGDHVVASVAPKDNRLEAVKIVFGKIFDHMDMHHK